MNAELNRKPTLLDVQGGLRHHLLSLAIVLNDIYGPHALRAVLKLTDSRQPNDYVALADADVSALRLFHLLPEAFDYAFNGRMSDLMREQVFESPSYFDQLNDFLGMVEGNPLVECVHHDIPESAQPWNEGALRALIDMGLARRALDGGDDLDAKAIALLADMTERSVQNAFSLKGPGHLPSAKRNGISQVENSVAKRWLEGRKGFLPTARVAFDGNAMPPTLDSQTDLRAFLRARVGVIYGDDRGRIGNGIEISEELLERKLYGDLQVELSDASPLARGLQLDERWLVTAILRINHPREARLLLEAARRPDDAVVSKGHSRLSIQKLAKKDGKQ
jgi:hypothetical protein